MKEKGDYWIIDLDDEYQWVVVVGPKRDYLWILSRTPTMDATLYKNIVTRVSQKGYEPVRLQRTQQIVSSEKSP